MNLFLPADVDKWDLLMLHWSAWEKGLKSLYYCRSRSKQRAEHIGGDGKISQVENTQRANYEECLSCQ